MLVFQERKIGRVSLPTVGRKELSAILLDHTKMTVRYTSAIFVRSYRIPGNPHLPAVSAIRRHVFPLNASQGLPGKKQSNAKH